MGRVPVPHTQALRIYPHTGGGHAEGTSQVLLSQKRGEQDLLQQQAYCCPTPTTLRARVRKYKSPLREHPSHLPEDNRHGKPSTAPLAPRRDVLTYLPSGGFTFRQSLGEKLPDIAVDDITLFPREAVQKVLFAVQVKERPRSFLVLGKALFDHLFLGSEHEASNTEGGRS